MPYFTICSLLISFLLIVGSVSASETEPYPLGVGRGSQIFIHPPFCEDGSQNVEVTIDFYDATYLVNSDAMSPLTLRNLLGQTWQSPHSNCFSGSFQVVANISFMGEPIGQGSFVLNGRDVQILSYVVDQPTRNSRLGDLAQSLLSMERPDAILTLEEFLAAPDRTIQELQIANLLLAGRHYFMFRDASDRDERTPPQRRDVDVTNYYGPEGEQALLRSAELGNAWAAVVLLRSSGLWDEMQSVPYYERQGQNLVTPAGVRYFEEAGYYFQLALRNRSILAIKLHETLEHYGVSTQSGYAASGDQPPNRYSIERALLRAITTDSSLLSETARVTPGVTYACDENWCDFSNQMGDFGSLAQFRWSVGSDVECSVNDEFANCAFFVSYVLAPNPESDFMNTPQGDLYAEIANPAPDVQAVRGVFERIDGRWELIEQLERQ